MDRKQKKRKKKKKKKDNTKEEDSLPRIVERESMITLEKKNNRKSDHKHSKEIFND